MNAGLTADQILPITGASVTALAQGRGIVLRDPDGDLLDVMFAMPEYGPCIAGGWRRATGGWALAAGQAAADEPIDVTFLRPRRATTFLTRTPAQVHRLGDLWVAEAAGTFTAAMVRTPAGVRARRLDA